MSGQDAHERAIEIAEAEKSPSLKYLAMYADEVRFEHRGESEDVVVVVRSVHPPGHWWTYYRNAWSKQGSWDEMDAEEIANWIADHAMKRQAGET